MLGLQSAVVRPCPPQILQGRRKNRVRKRVRNLTSKIRHLSRTCSAVSTNGSQQVAELDWDSLDFSIKHIGHVPRFTLLSSLVLYFQTMYKATADPSGDFEGGTCPYEALQMMPSAQVLNYGQSIFEGQ